MLDIESPDVASPRMRHAGRDLLSLALMDARNHSLRWMSAIDEALAAPGFVVTATPEVDPPLWLLGHIGWFQERWIARNVHRRRGVDADAGRPALASIAPDADAMYDPAQMPRAQRWRVDLPGLQATKQYLTETMDITLDLLESADETDSALYFFRLALFHEDQQGEAFAEMAQTLGLAIGASTALLQPRHAPPPREALFFPASRWPLGSSPGGFVFDNEKWTHQVQVPEFEIDAQPVSWAQYAEFVEDGGYDETRWWSPHGRVWLAQQGRRAPRHVDQMRRTVLQHRFGQLTRVPMAQPVQHVTWHEAEAWCRWAGRRLPSEVEWEAAAQSYSRGFVWGGAWEWTASTFRPYPGFTSDPWVAYSLAGFGTHKVLRGASVATRARLRHPKFRRFALAERDDMFCGFRSCAP